MNKFIKIKENKLSSPDLSKKGSVDDAIKDLVEFINKKSQFVTTSSCSGRIIVVSHVSILPQWIIIIILNSSQREIS